MTSPDQNQTLHITPRKILYILIGLDILLLLLSLVGQYLRIFPNYLNFNFPLLVHNYVVEFDVNAEANIPTYFSVSLAVISAALLFIIAYFKHAEKNQYRFHWMALSLWLVYISLDDASVIHEKASKYLKGLSSGGGWFEYKWVFVGLAVVVVLGVTFFRFWLALDNKHKLLFLLSAGIFFGGALGIEMIGGRWAYSYGSNNYTYKVFTTVEQGLQYAGLGLLVYSLLSYIQMYYPRFLIVSAAVPADETPALVVKPHWAYILGGAGLVIVLLSGLNEFLNINPNFITFHIPFKAFLLEDFNAEFEFIGKPNIAVYFNMLVLDIAALLLFIIARLKTAARDADKSGWRWLAWVIFYLAVDNLAVFHNKIHAHLREAGDMTGWFTYNSAVLLVVVFIILLAAFFTFWLRLKGKDKTLLLVFALTYFAGKLGGDTLKIYAEKGGAHMLLAIIYQLLQYGGGIALVYMLLRYLRNFQRPEETIQVVTSN